MNDFILKGFSDEFLKLARKTEGSPVTDLWEKAKEAKRKQDVQRLVSPSGKVSPKKAKELNRLARQRVMHMVKAEGIRQKRRRKAGSGKLGRLGESFSEVIGQYGKTFGGFGKGMAATIRGQGLPSKPAPTQIAKPKPKPSAKPNQVAQVAKPKTTKL